TDGNPRASTRAAGVQPFRREDVAISSAPKARCGVGVFDSGMRPELSLLSGALEFVAEVLKVFLADLQLQHFFDHRREVCPYPEARHRRAVCFAASQPGRMRSRPLPAPRRVRATRPRALGPHDAPRPTCPGS